MFWLFLFEILQHLNKQFQLYLQPHSARPHPNSGCQPVNGRFAKEVIGPAPGYAEGRGRVTLDVPCKITIYRTHAITMATP